MDFGAEAGRSAASSRKADSAAGKIAIGQPQIGQHGTRGERRHGLRCAPRGGWSVDRRQGKRKADAASDAGAEVALDGVERRVIHRVQSALRRHAGSEGGEQRGKSGAIGGRQHQQIGERPTLRVEDALAVARASAGPFRVKAKSSGSVIHVPLLSACERSGRSPPMRVSRSRDLHGGNDVADALGDPLGQRPAAAVDQDVRVLVGGHAQIAARHGGQHDIVAALRADEEGVGAGPRTILGCTPAAEAKQMTRISRCARGLIPTWRTKKACRRSRLRASERAFPDPHWNRSRSAACSRGSSRRLRARPRRSQDMPGLRTLAPPS